MNPLRQYEDKPLSYTDLPFKNFKDLLTSQSNNKSNFIHYYNLGILENTLTFAQFFTCVEELSQKIIQLLPAVSNYRIAVAMENSVEGLVAYAAVLNLNLTLLPLDPNRSEEYYLNISNHFKCDFVISSLSHISHKCFKSSCSYSFFENRNLISKIVYDREVSKIDPAIIFTSSGTTGKPKGIEQSFDALVINSISTIRIHDLNKDSTHFCVLPIFHVNAFSFSFFTSLLVGNCLVLNRNFSQTNFWQTVWSTSPRIISLIPPMIRLLIEDPRDFKIPTSVEYVVSAASNLGKSTLVNFVNKFNVRIIQAYGLSEAVNFSTTFPTCLDDENYFEIILKEKYTSIGVEVWGNHIFLLNNNEIVSTENTNGEICIRGWNVMLGYFASIEKTEEAFKDNYLHTGDIGYFRIFNNQKYYYIVGRSKEAAKVNGKYIYLNEVDEMIHALDFIENVCSVCYLDINKEECLGVYVILTSNLSFDSDQLKRQISKALPREYRPSKVIIGDNILLTASGKKRRSEMAKKYFEFDEKI